MNCAISKRNFDENNKLTINGLVIVCFSFPEFGYNFETINLNDEENVILLFSSPTFLECNMKHNMELISKLNIKSIPCFIGFKNGIMCNESKNSIFQECKDKLLNTDVIEYTDEVYSFDDIMNEGKQIPRPHPTEFVDVGRIQRDNDTTGFIPTRSDVARMQTHPYVREIQDNPCLPIRKPIGQSVSLPTFAFGTLENKIPAPIVKFHKVYDEILDKMVNFRMLDEHIPEYSKNLDRETLKKLQTVDIANCKKNMGQTEDIFSTRANITGFKNCDELNIPSEDIPIYTQTEVSKMLKNIAT